MTHPLTDEIIEEIAEDVFYYDYSIPIFRCDMRSAADWQLEQVMKWLDENLSNYTNDDYLGDCEPLHKLEGDLKKAMRPQEDN